MISTCGAFEEIAAIARLLARTGNTAQARQLPQAHAFATLNARVAQLYRLTIEEFEHVLGTFPLVPREDRDAALREFSGMTA